MLALDCRTDRRVRAAVHALEAQRKSEEAARREGRQHKQQFSDEAMARAQELAVSRLSGQFAQTGTETGRLAMDEPNLQVRALPAADEFHSTHVLCLQE
jgi:hypothetical protein